MPRPTAPPSFNQLGPDDLFHIDYEWWTREKQDLEITLRKHLCAEHRDSELSLDDDDSVEWINPETGQLSIVRPMDYILLRHCSTDPDYLNDRLSLIDVVFRALLANANEPLSVVELAERTGRDVATILRTLTGKTVYLGLRPIE